MSPLLCQFIAKLRDLLQSIGQHLNEMELASDDDALMSELSGAAEDPMDTVLNGRVAYSRELAELAQSDGQDRRAA